MECSVFGVSILVYYLNARQLTVCAAGVSYGSALGEAVAALFPERMDKVVIDAILDPTEYFAGPG
jgi:hypothetical protein